MQITDKHKIPTTDHDDEGGTQRNTDAEKFRDIVDFVKAVAQDVSNNMKSDINYNNSVILEPTIMKLSKGKRKIDIRHDYNLLDSRTAITMEKSNKLRKQSILKSYDLEFPSIRESWRSSGEQRQMGVPNIYIQAPPAKDLPKPADYLFDVKSFRNTPIFLPPPSPSNV